MESAAADYGRSNGAGSVRARHAVAPGVLRLAVACAALAWLPADAVAQKQAFVDALLEFTSAASGTYGDEGGRMEAALDRMSVALEEWDRAIAAVETGATGDAEMRFRLGGLYAERGRYADALRELEAGNRVAPRDARLHQLRAVVLEAMDRPREAARAYRAAWALDPDDPIKAYHALLADPADRDAASARERLSAAYRRLLRSGPEAPPSFTRLDPVPDDAANAPVLPYAAYADGYRLVAQGAYDAALARLRQAAAGDPLLADEAAASGLLRDGIALLRQGRLADARARLDAAMTEVTASSEVHRIQALVSWAGLQYDRSLDHLEHAIRLNPDDERSRLTLARVLMDAGRHAEAEHALLAARDALPASGLAQWWLGWVYESLARPGEARQAFERAAATGVLAGRARLQASIARLARHEADFAGVLEALERRVRANPGSAAAHRDLGLAYLVQARPDEALAGLIVAVLLDPRDHDAHVGIGQIHLEAGRHAEAVEALRYALVLAPDTHGARYALAMALTQQGQAGEAAQHLDAFARAQHQALAERRLDIALQALKDEAALRTGEGGHDRAAALWQQVVDRDPGQAANHLHLATALERAGRTEAAIRHYEAVAALDASPDVYRHLADLYAAAGRSGDSARARDRYDRARREERTATEAGR